MLQVLYFFQHAICAERCAYYKQKVQSNGGI